MKVNHKRPAIERRKQRIRAKVRGTAERPRLTVFRSNRFIYLQVINDQEGKTVAAATSATKKKDKKAVAKLVSAQETAKVLAEKLKKAKITKLVFDRGAYRYHGRVKAVAETMREQGLQV